MYLLYPSGRHPPPANTPHRQTPPGQTPPRADIPPGRHTSLVRCPPQQTTTAADGTHPTGMHSCYRLQGNWGKVMFLHVCVILFTGGGVLSQHALQVVSQHALQQVSWGRCLLLGGCLFRGGCSRGVCSEGVPGGDPPGTATAAGGTHPTGMHSCYLLYLQNIGLSSFD